MSEFRKCGEESPEEYELHCHRRGAGSLPSAASFRSDYPLDAQILLEADGLRPKRKNRFVPSLWSCLVRVFDQKQVLVQLLNGTRVRGVLESEKRFARAGRRSPADRQRPQSCVLSEARVLTPGARGGLEEAWGRVYVKLTAVAYMCAAGGVAALSGEIRSLMRRDFLAPVRVLASRLARNEEAARASPVDADR